MRNDVEYKELSKGFDFLFDDQYELEIINAEMQIQGAMIEMWESLENVKDKTTESYKKSRSRYLVLFKAISFIDTLYGRNRVLKHKLLLSENELANYKFIYSQNYGDAKSAVRIDNPIDPRIPYTDYI